MSRIITGIVCLILGGAIGFGSYAFTHKPQDVDTALGCVETVITKSAAPSGPAMADGGEIAFRDDVGQKHGANNAEITSLYIPPGGYPVGATGDRVRACLLSVPAKENVPGGCDPSVDSRGREFLVYDRANASAQVYTNGEHLCGGA
jgi:hypothetical protein